MLYLIHEDYKAKHHSSRVSENADTLCWPSLHIVTWNPSAHFLWYPHSSCRLLEPPFFKTLILNLDLLNIIALVALSILTKLLNKIFHRVCVLLYWNSPIYKGPVKYGSGVPTHLWKYDRGVTTTKVYILFRFPAS